MLRSHFETLDCGVAGARLGWRATALASATSPPSAHLSVIDYMGEAPWEDFRAVRTWYAKVKSRPSFRPLLTDRQPGLPPSAHYDDLDF